MAKVGERFKSLDDLCVQHTWRLLGTGRLHSGILEEESGC